MQRMISRTSSADLTPTTTSKRWWNCPCMIRFKAVKTSPSSLPRYTRTQLAPLLIPVIMPTCCENSMELPWSIHESPTDIMIGWRSGFINLGFLSQVIAGLSKSGNKSTNDFIRPTRIPEEVGSPRRMIVLREVVYFLTQRRFKVRSLPHPLPCGRPNKVVEWKIIG